MKEGLITLTQKQLKTFKVINSFMDKSITRQQAAELLGISSFEKVNSTLKIGDVEISFAKSMKINGGS